MNIRRCGCVGVAALISVAGTARAQPLPPNFVDQTVIAGWDQAVGVTFASDGRGFVWEKAGRVWLVENGVKSSQPLIDIQEEVGNWGDYGLLGFAIDPNFYTNGYIYLLYAVDYHHLKYFGTPQYNPNTSTDYHDTIGRVTRYTCNAAGGFRSVNYATRQILVGESMSTGFPLCFDSHGVGTLMFGEDGSLLAGCGDGASYNTADVGGNQPGSSNTALADGIINATQNVGAYRSQLTSSLSGKIIRINPANGDGLPSNPLYDGAAPRAARSRIWAMGMRNPFRYAIRPGTGNPNQAAGDPGTLYIGDVGWNDRESVCIAPSGGINFGWPAYEGLEVQPEYTALSPVNRDAPNPLFGGACPQFFKFTSLIIPPTQGTPSWPNPCNVAQQIPSSIPRFVRRHPVIDWGHGHPVRVGVFQGGQLTAVSIESPQSPVQGFQFGGSSVTGGVWYSGSQFPAAYDNTYFAADFTGKCINNFIFDANDNLLQVRPFATAAGGVVCMALHPVDRSLYYMSYDDTGVAALRRIYWTSNLPPTAQAAATPTYGAAPLTVNFSSAGSSDPENQPLSYHWDFGDGSPGSTAANPTHVYQDVQDITSTGTIVARIFSLNPPTPTGPGNYDPEVIRDNDFPPVGSDDFAREYDTFHDGAQGTDDWIGYTFASPREVRWLVFQEGIELADSGGWWDTLGVEYKSGASWLPVTGFRIEPAYPGHNSVNFETFKIGFVPVTCTGIRLRGAPGGYGGFMSVGELRVLATPLTPSTTPRSHTATLTVTDNLNSTATATVLISPDNTPPQVTITSPVNGSMYPVGPDLAVQLRATTNDVETPGQLACRWQAIFHHDQHTHPEPPINQCQPDVVLPSGGCDATYYWEFRLTVTDPQGLGTSASVFMYPNCMCYPNCDASSVAPILNANDFVCFLNHFAAGDEHYANCDGSSIPPILNALDFGCFLDKFAAGCS